jgi:DNA ligase-1
LKIFATLVHTLGSSTGSNEKLAALAHYFSTADDRDKVWVIALFSGRRPKRLVTSTQLKQWCYETATLPDWLFNECYDSVGDLAETISLLLPEATTTAASLPLHVFFEQLLALATATEEEKKDYVLQQWQQLSKDECFVFNKFITGGFRIGVSQKTIVNALAKSVQLDASTIAHRISGNWNPATITFEQLLSATAAAEDLSKPYPFYLAYALEQPLEEMGTAADWQAEWKWDGIRGQIIQRNGELFVWSRGEELMTDKFQEYQSLTELLPAGTVLDGEIICMPSNSKEVKPLPFAILQTRIGRKQVTRKQLQEAPAAFIAYDLLEWEGKDIRHLPLVERRKLLEQLIQQIQHPVLHVSPVISFNEWQLLEELRTQARDNGSEGLMLKQLHSVYQSGRKRGDWWKWKIDPLVIDCVLIYAQKGHGRRSNLYTDYTFAVKDGDRLVSFTKAYSGLTDEEFAAVDAFVKRNSLEKFGPVRTVKPELVFEIAFEGIAKSSRHKSGVALRFPRMSRWRKDKTVDEINTLEDLQQMLTLYGK